MSDELRQCWLCGTCFWLLERNLLRAVQPDEIDAGLDCPECGSPEHRRLPMLSDYELRPGLVSQHSAQDATAHEEGSR